MCESAQSNQCMLRACRSGHKVSAKKHQGWSDFSRLACNLAHDTLVLIALLSNEDLGAYAQ